MKISEGQLSELRAAIRSRAYDGSVSANYRQVDRPVRDIWDRRSCQRDVSWRAQDDSRPHPGAGAGADPADTAGRAWNITLERGEDGRLRQEDRGRLGFSAMGFAALAGERPPAVAAGHIQDQQRPAV